MSELNPLINYIPATLHECESRWYIRYKAYHPGKGKLYPKVIKLNRISSLPERRRFGRSLVHKINIKLAGGWNPFIEQEASKSFETLSRASKSFMNDKRDKRPDTLRAYNNFIELFVKYCNKKFQSDIIIINISTTVAIGYMDYVWNKGISSVRFNNYLGFQILFFNWLIKHEYSKANPFLAIQKRREQPKIRIMDIAKSDRKKIHDYLSRTNPRFLAMVLLAFHSLLRPNEITQLKKNDFNLRRQFITIREETAKNGKERIAMIPDVMIDSIKVIINGVHENTYIFSRQFFPGNTILDSREITRYWGDLRETLKLKKEIQFYSLRDSGIIQKLRDGLDPKTVMELAGHSNLETTNKYVYMAHQKPNSEAIKKMSKF